MNGPERTIGTRGLVFNEPLIFEQGSPGRIGYSLPPCDVPEKHPDRLIPAHLGFRYAASSYINVSGADEATRETARDNLLENELHGKTFSLAPGDGGFRIEAYPYYYKVSEVPPTNALRTRVTGGFPLEGTSYNNGSWVQVTKSDGTTENVRISGVSLHTYAGYNEVRFWTYSGSPWPNNIALGAPVIPVCVPGRATLTVTDGDVDGLIDYIPFVASSGAAAFPARNGIFTVTLQDSTERILSYRELDITNRRMSGEPISVSTSELEIPGKAPSAPVKAAEAAAVAVAQVH